MAATVPGVFNGFPQHQAGARLRLACQTAGIDARTLQRWKARCARTLECEMTGDGRPQAVHPRPSHALSQAERVGLLRMAVGADRKFARRQHALNHSARGTFFRGKANAKDASIVVPQAFQRRNTLKPLPFDPQTNGSIGTPGLLVAPLSQQQDICRCGGRGDDCPGSGRHHCPLYLLPDCAAARHCGYGVCHLHPLLSVHHHSRTLLQRYGKLSDVIAYIDGIMVAIIGSISSSVIVIAKRSVVDIRPLKSRCLPCSFGLEI